MLSTECPVDKLARNAIKALIADDGKEDNVTMCNTEDAEGSGRREEGAFTS